MANYVGALIEFARNSKGISQSELASRVTKINQPILSKIEQGLLDVSDDIIKEISFVLGFPLTFFQLATPSMVTLDVLFRKRVTISQKENLKINTRLSLIGIAVDKLMRNVRLPDYTIPSLDFDFDFDSPSEIAKETRRLLGLGKMPIQNIFTVLEKNGIIVFEISCVSDKFDGVSFVTSDQNVIIVINKNLSNDRKRFTLAHELGHVVMHISKPIPSWKKESLDDEANEFANEFLFPSTEAEKYLRNLSINQLGSIKKHWLISKQAIIYRSKKYIRPEKVKYLMIELSRMGERKYEKDPVPIDSPSIIKQVIKHFKETLHYTIDDLGDALLIGKDLYEEIFEEQKPFTVFKSEKQFELDLSDFGEEDWE